MTERSDRFFKRRIACPSDPVLDRGRDGVSPIDDQRGNLPMRATYTGERAWITEVFPDTQTYTVRGERSGEMRGVFRMTQSPGDKKTLPTGTCVAITKEFGGQNIILGVLPITSDANNNDKIFTLTGDTSSGGGDPLYGQGNANCRTPRTPRDLIPGDEALVGTEGNAIAVLTGGVNIMKSGLAQVQTHTLNDLVQIICRNFRMHSDMGTSEIKNDGGGLNYSFRGGANQTVEAGSDQEKWTIRLDVGAIGDLFRFELTRPDGNTIFRLYVNGDGKVEMFGAQGIDLMGGSKHTQKHLKDREIVIKASDTQTIGGDQSKTVRGKKDETVSSNVTQMVGNDRTISVVRNETRTVGGKQEEKIVGGNALLAKPGDIARETTINNGSWKIDIGSPLAGASPVAQPGFELNTYLGNIDQRINIQGNYTVSTILGKVDISSFAGPVALKTLAGTANLDGTSVNLGPLGPSFANPVLKGTVHNVAMSTYLSTELGAMAPHIATIAPLLAVLAPPLGMIFWYVSPLISNLFFAFMSSDLAMLSTWLAAKSALLAALPSMLSTVVFTA